MMAVAVYMGDLAGKIGSSSNSRRSEHAYA
jgi:hypothetical protein